MDIASADSSDRLRELTAREREVATALGQGLSNTQIGAVTYMSTATVKSYVSRPLEELGADNRVQVALLVQQPTSRAMTTGTRPEACAPAPTGLSFVCRPPAFS